jgi:hypothetical protein
MKVLDHEPAFWFLLGEGERLFLDVNCGHSIVSYDVLIELNESEQAQRNAQGRVYLSKLATAVHDSHPGLRNSQSSYTSRNIAARYGAEVLEAVRAWRCSQTP